MNLAMTINVKSLHGACACAIAALGAICPAGALAASHTSSTPTFPIPASARVHGDSSAPATTAPATTTPATTIPTATTPTVATPATPAPTGTPATGATATSPSTGATTAIGVARKTGPTHSRLSTGALALAILAGLLALGCAVWVLARWLVFEPRWTLSLMHSLDEASFRASSTWAELADWARLGR
jgi:hypothetical protein